MILDDIGFGCSFWRWLLEFTNGGRRNWHGVVGIFFRGMEERNKRLGSEPYAFVY